MPSLLSRVKGVPLAAKVLCALALLLWVPFAAGQRYLGDLLNFGAKRLSAEEFKQEVVQRSLVGPTTGGLTLEVLYATSGVISGRGTNYLTGAATVEVNGEWKIDDSGKICTTMRLAGPTFGPAGVVLPPRCQFWFKYQDQYFVSDSDTDRYAPVVRRTLKQ
jgi:hypothetical protein